MGLMMDNLFTPMMLCLILLILIPMKPLFVQFKGRMFRILKQPRYFLPVISIFGLFLFWYPGWFWFLFTFPATSFHHPAIEHASLKVEHPRTVLNQHLQRETVYHAASSIIDWTAIGGFGRSNNFARRNKSQFQHQPNGLLLLAESDSDSEFIRLRLVNNTWYSATFNAQDSRLHIIQEALGSDGEWHAIETVSRSYCGHSMHKLTLPGGQHWEFPSPYYDGPFKTRLRFRMVSPDLVSNEFEGSIHLDQFIPSNRSPATELMDPRTLDFGMLNP